jgi:hypothetical protein
MNKSFLIPNLSRRNILKGGAATAALWAGRSASLRAFASTEASAGNQPYPGGQITQIPMTVTSTVSGGVGSTFVGISVEKEKMIGDLFSSWDDSLIGVFKRLGKSVLRVGGSTTDTTVWDPNGKGGQSGLVAPADIDNLAAFLKVVDWKCIYDINLAGVVTGITNPTMAAEEAAYVYKTLGPYLDSVALGNEPDLYGKVGNPFANDWSLDQFLALWTEFRNAIVRKTAGIPVSGPEAGFDATTWTIPFAETVTSQKINMMTQHYSPVGATSPNATVAELLTTSLHRDLVRQVTALHEASQQLGGMPYRVTECEDVFSSASVPASPNLAGSYTGALWALDFMFTCAYQGAQGVNFHSGGPVSSFTPLLTQNDYVIGIAPQFYALMLMTLAGTGSCLETTVSSGSLNVSGYAMHLNDGGYSVIVSNKDPSHNIQIQLELPRGVTYATLMEMTQRTGDAKVANVWATSGVTIQGADIGLDGSFWPGDPYKLVPDGEKLTFYIPPYSAVLVQAS